MTTPWVSYYIESRNKQALLFLPGYTNGFSNPLIKKLISLYTDKKVCDVLGLEMQYEEDTPDVFDRSQERIRSAIHQFSTAHPDKDLIVVAKSLGGALCLYNLNSLNIAGLVVLGLPVVLGWPPRISLLSTNTSRTPEYKTEWLSVLSRVTVPVRIINGGADSLTDNVFLKEVSAKNTRIQVMVIEGANHGLENSVTKDIHVEESASEIDRFLVVQ